MYQITIIGHICGNVYCEILNELFKRSDSFLFHLPNMGKMLVNERNIEYFPEYELGYTEEDNQEKHISYIKQVQPYLEIIKNDIIESHIDTGYLNQVSNIEMEVFRVSISENSKAFFSKTNDFLNWKYPKLPEDPCFLSNGECIFQCLSHEELCFLNYYDKKIIKLLKTNNIDFYRSK